MLSYPWQSVGPTAEGAARPSRQSTGSRGSCSNRRKWGEKPVEACGVLVYGCTSSGKLVFSMGGKSA